MSIKTFLAEPGLAGDGARISIEITDSGPGIPEDIRDKIFDPYFTTKAKGTGLGLALAYRIMEDHGGRITLETGPDGTTFVVELRVAGGGGADAGRSARAGAEQQEAAPTSEDDTGPSQARDA